MHGTLFLAAFAVAAASTTGKAAAQSAVASEDACVDTERMALAAEVELQELTEDSFENFLDQGVVSCVLFYEKEDDAFHMAEREFRRAAVLAAANANVSMASMHISSNPQVARAVVATGPISVKLFDRRLRSENYFDLYALHSHGPHFHLSSSSLYELAQDYVLNSTGHEELDRVSRAFATEVLQRRPEQAKALLTEAQVLAQDLRHGAAYVMAMESVLDQGLYVIAKAFNDVSLQLGNAAQPQQDQPSLTLEQRASALLFMHISSELSKPLLGGAGEVPTYKRKASTPKQDSPSSAASNEARDERRAAAMRAAALAGGSALE